MGDVVLYIYKVAGEDTPAKFTPINIGAQYTNRSVLPIIEQLPRRKMTSQAFSNSGVTTVIQQL